MAPLDSTQDSFYLAPLDKCLAQGHRLISWTTAFQSLSKLDLARQSPSLQSFVTDPRSIKALSHPFSEAEPTTSHTKAAFDQYTAHVSSSKESSYDITQIKEDAQWLSEEVKIDEVTALRIVVIEWQNRSGNRILQGYTVEERISLRSATNTKNLGSSVVTKEVDAVIQENTKFNSQAKRRFRLLDLFLSEKKCLLDLTTLMAANSMARPAEPEGRSYWTAKEKDDIPLPWLSGAANQVHGDGMSGGKEQQLIVEIIEAIEVRLRGLESGSGWAVEEEDTAAIERKYQEVQLDGFVRLLQLLLIKTGPVSIPLPASEVKSWFEFADKYGFFERFQLPSQDMQSYVAGVQALVCVISIQVLKLPYTLDYFNYPSVRGEQLPAPVDLDCQRVLNDVFLNALNHGSSIATPAIAAWGMILAKMQDVTQTALGGGGSDDESFMEETPTKPRRKSQPSLPTAFADAMENVMDLSVEEPIKFFGETSMNSGAVAIVGQLAQMLQSLTTIAWTTKLELHARVTLLEWMREGLLVTEYSSQVIDATLAILFVDEDDFPTDVQSTVSIRSSLIQIFVRDDVCFIPKLLHVAQSRYPYELTPFLNLCKALCPDRQAIKSNLEALPLSEATSRFTQLMPREFRDYQVIREDEEQNCIQTTADLPLFTDRVVARGTKSALAETQQLVKGGAENESFIPAGTVGFIMDKDANRPPLTVMWEHRHSVLRYLGFLLSTVPASSTRRNLLSFDGDVDKETQADIIGLLAALLDATVDTSVKDGDNDHGNARWVLEQASDALDRNQDIIAVVSDIFEDALGSQFQSREEGSTELLCACIHFIHAIASVVPGRVWPLLARSDFLDINGRGAKMTVVLQSSELATGRSQLLLQCVKLYETLLTDVMQHATTRKTPSVATGKRFSQASEVATGSSRKVVSRILSTITQSFVSIVLNSTNDNQAFANGNDKIHTRIVKSFDMMLSAVYGYDDQNVPSDKLTAAFAPSASLLAEVFLAPKSNSAVTAMLSLIMTASSGGLVQSTSSDLLSTTLRFFVSLLETATTLENAPSFLEQQLFQSLPFLARVYISDEAAKQHIIALLSLLVTRADISDAEPRSLLGHLGPQTAENLLAELANLDKPLNTSELEVGIWNLFASVMRCRQQWFATYVLTGDSPKKSLSKKDTKEATRKAILELALDEVAALESLSTGKALSVLTFINAAQSYWPWITSKLRIHEPFMNRIVDYLGSVTNDVGRDAEEQSYRLASAAQIVDILALYLHNMRQMGDISFIKKLGPKLGYLRAHGVAVPKYNTSLHSNLKRNFEKKYPGCSLVNIKALRSKPAFGDNYFYDIAFADQLLGRDVSWSGSKNSFRDEIKRANKNLSQVEAHILLMSNWRSLAIELSQSVGQEKTLQKYLATAVHQCLVANTESSLTEAVFQHLIDSRIELALALTQRLVIARSDVPTMRTLLTTTWDTLRHSVPDPENAFAGTNVAQYRSLLRLLLLVLQPHTYMETSGPVTSTGESGTPTQPSTEWSTDILPLLVEIVTEVVGKGFRSLTTLLHEEATSVEPSDFALLTALLQTILRIPDVASVHTHLTLRLCDTAVHRYAIALFSWSDRLTIASSTNQELKTSPDANVDPIYADLTLSFLHTLTTIPQMAEYLATEGILSQLSTAPILAALRNPPSRQSRPSARSATQSSIGYGPLDSPTRFHHFWSRSLLPLTLNILHAVGASFAAEAAAFLNTFPAQLERASICLSAPNGGDITLNEASELAILSLLALSLERYARDPVAVVGGQSLELAGFDKAGLKEDVEGLLRNGGLEGRVVAVGKREAAMAREKGKSEKEGASRLVVMVRGELEVVLRCLGGTV